jgi:hypothetical protein
MSPTKLKRRGVLDAVAQCADLYCRSSAFSVVVISLGLVLPTWVVASDAERWVRIAVHVVVWPISFLAGTSILALIYRCQSPVSLKLVSGMFSESTRPAY